MNKTLSEAKEFIKAIKDELPSNDQLDTVIAAPNIFTPKIIEWTEGSSLKVSAQNSHFEDSGAFTGATSPMALAEMGTDYVILGHSERRNIFHETDEDVNKKVHAVLNHRMTPIICVGESLEQRESGETEEWLAGQIKASLNGLGADEVKKVIIAYEPLWAIGTGKTATAEQANNTIKQARETVANLYDADTANLVRFQYGGSVKPANVDELLAQSDIDGALVGGASLEVNSFLKLLEAANK